MESRVARLEQQVESHEGDIRRVMPMFVEVAENRVRMEQMKSGLDQAVHELREFREQQETREAVRRKEESERDAEQRERDVEQRKERKRDRQWMVGAILATGMLIVASIALLVPIG